MAARSSVAAGGSRCCSTIRGSSVRQGDSEWQLRAAAAPVLRDGRAQDGMLEELRRPVDAVQHMHSQTFDIELWLTGAAAGT